MQHAFTLSLVCTVTNAEIVPLANKKGKRESALIFSSKLKNGSIE